MPNFQTATVTSHTNPASTFHILRLKPDQPLDFQPGQHIMIKVGETKINHYSLASSPSTSKLELIVNTKPGNQGSQYIEKLQVGEQVEFLGPLGNFQLNHPDDSSEIIFLANGSGISTIKSMLEHLLLNIQEKRPLSLYFGLRHNTDIFLHDYFFDLEQKYTNFTFKPTLSQPDKSWSGLNGHITHHLQNDYQDGRSISAYLCGSGQMIEDAKSILLNIGTPEERIYHEKFY